MSKTFFSPTVSSTLIRSVNYTVNICASVSSSENVQKIHNLAMFVMFSENYDIVVGSTK